MTTGPEREPAKDGDGESLGFDPLHLMATLILGWLVPGLGHVTVGRAAKGLLFFLVLGTTYAVGLLYARENAISPDEHPFAFVGQLGLGLPTVIIVLMQRGAEVVTPDPEQVPKIDTGILFTTVAGLLNYLVLLDAFLWAKEGPREGRDGEGKDGAESSAAAPPTEAAPESKKEPPDAAPAATEAGPGDAADSETETTEEKAPAGAEGESS